ncbi:CDP-diacylglycerol---serine O-phosphatidyltransferase [Gammaproteobacteria bacterium]
MPDPISSSTPPQTPSQTLEIPRRPRGIYLIPNLFTTATLFFGFFAIVSAMRGRFESAAIAIFVAMVCDSLDGRIARLTHTQTAFGAEYDSLSDMVSFGLAPALVIYEWSLQGLGKFGWLVAFIYAAATALRLARFNTQLGVTDKRYFQGLPCPSAAAIVAGLVWVGGEYEMTGTSLQVPASLLTLLASLLMVSNIRYNSFKEPNLLRGKVPFVSLFLMVLAFVGIAIHPPQVLFTGFMTYAISGPVLTLIQLRRRRVSRRLGQPSSDENESNIDHHP